MSGWTSPAEILPRSSRPPTSRSRRAASASMTRAGGAALVVGPRGVRVGEAAGRRPDAGQRRAQVMRDRVDQGGLESFALAGDLQLGAIRRSWSRRRRSPAGRRRGPGSGCPRRSGRPRRAPGRDERAELRHRVRCGRGGPSRPSGRPPWPSGMRADPAGRLVAGRADQLTYDGRAAGRGPPAVSATTVPGPVGPTWIAHAFELEIDEQALHDVRCGVLRRRCRRQGPAASANRLFASAARAPRRRRVPAGWPRVDR